ncbi:MAG TPA: hypothetical protein VGN42_27755 [Pirellulales bacterium]|nr:hypothetical protein [Pirellulales bacterium]
MASVATSYLQSAAAASPPQFWTFARFAFPPVTISVVPGGK